MNAKTAEDTVSLFIFLFGGTLQENTWIKIENLNLRFNFLMLSTILSGLFLDITNKVVNSYATSLQISSRLNELQH